VLATAAAVEAAEAAAEAAAEVAVETLLAFQAQQLGGAAAPPGSLEEAWHRELATAVVAEAAEAAAEAVLDAALSAGTAGAAEGEESSSTMEERSVAGAAREDDESSSSSFSAEVTVIDRAYSESAGMPEAAEDGRAEEEAEVPPPSLNREPPQEPFFTDQVQGQQEPAAPRPVGMFSLAKEIAFQALAGASVGKALGTAQGLLGALSAGLGVGGSTSLDEYGRDAELVSGLFWVISIRCRQVVARQK
jgi:hypothetical protein